MKGSFENQTALIEGLKMGNEVPTDFGWDYYHNRLCVYATVLIKDNLIAEDIVPKCFLYRFWKKAKQN